MRIQDGWKNLPPGCKNVGSGILDKHPGSAILVPDLRIVRKHLRIREEICTDPQHCIRDSGSGSWIYIHHGSQIQGSKRYQKPDLRSGSATLSSSTSTVPGTQIRHKTSRCSVYGTVPKHTRRQVNSIFVQAIILWYWQGKVPRTQIRTKMSRKCWECFCSVYGLENNRVRNNS